MTHEITFRLLESSQNSIIHPDAGYSALDEWYSRIRDIPLNSFDIDDLCRACRQRLYLDHVVPIAIKRLESNPLAGAIYDGELLAALTSVTDEYWRINTTLSNTLLSLIERVKRDSNDERIVADADVIAKSIGQIQH